MEEMLAKFIEEGKREHEVIEILIKEFRTTNELLLKERSNLLSELKIEVNELSKVVSNVVVQKTTVKGVTNRGGRITSEAPPVDKDLMLPKSKFNDDEPWYANFANYIVRKVVPPNWTFQKRKRFFSQVKTYFWEEPYAFKLCADNIIRRCVAGSEILKILGHCHSGPTSGHHSSKVTARKRDRWGYNPKDWSEKLDNALWAFRYAYKTPTGCTLGSKSRFMQLNELAELRDGAYENTRIYKEWTKKWHDSRLHGDKDFKEGDKVLLYNSRLKMYLGKLKSKWSGLNFVKTVYPHGELMRMGLASKSMDNDLFELLRMATIDKGVTMKL
ncbi:hypothetical protein Tco_1482036 [Tanacetum coccineum]